MDDKLTLANLIPVTTTSVCTRYVPRREKRSKRPVANTLVHPMPLHRTRAAHAVRATAPAMAPTAITKAGR